MKVFKSTQYQYHIGNEHLGVLNLESWAQLCIFVSFHKLIISVHVHESLLNNEYSNDGVLKDVGIWYNYRVLFL